jgi:2-desacetyl-2-hydroxyethyl bacteriochlorophyllide A dehydrogenase
MKALVCTKPGQLDYVNIKYPELKKGHAIVRIRNICICGTDLHAYEGTQPYFNYPRILGHELSGELVEFDDAPGFEKGAIVGFIPYINCASCNACLSGKTNCCVDLKVCGVHIDGGMADYFMIPSRLLVAADGLDFTEMALVEPMAIGAHGIRRASVNPGEFVLVAGAGPIGLGAIEFARIQGAELIVLDTNQSRLEFCKVKLGIKHVFHPADARLTEKLEEITNGDMPTVVVDASGNRQAILQGLNYLAHGGRYILIGLQKGDLVFSHPEFHKKEATLMSSRNATRQDFEFVIQSMKNKMIRPLEFVTNRVAFKDVAAGFPEWLNPSNGIIKVVVENE